MPRNRLFLIALVLIILSGNVSAQEFSIKDQCGDREENLFSIYDRSGGHAAEPGYFDTQVCASGVEEVELMETCSGGMNSILNLYQREDSHVSVYNEYRLSLCASFPAEVNSSCPTDNRIVSVSGIDNAHVAEPGEYSYSLCASQATVDTVTLEMKLDAEETYVDGDPASEGSYPASSLDYPYIVSGQPAGIVSYGDAVSIDYSIEDSEDVYSVTQEEGSFLLPNTENGYEEIESRQNFISTRTFTQQLSPSFAYLIPDTPTVRVIYNPDINLTGFDREQSGGVNLYVRYVSDDVEEPVVEIGLD